MDTLLIYLRTTTPSETVNVVLRPNEHSSSSIKPCEVNEITLASLNIYLSSLK